jgi:hypothetical protein
MTEEAKQTKREINWTPIIVVGAAIGGIYLIARLFQSGEESDKELAREILADWQLEFDELKSYTDNIYAGGRTPTEAETAAVSSMIDQMKLKELTIYELSKSVWLELRDLANGIAQSLGIIIGEVIAGYVAIRVIKRWIDKNRPPPNFPCPKCGIVYATEGALKYHITNTHIPTLAHATEAQQAFSQTSSWVQSLIADEGLQTETFIDWRTLSKVAIVILVAAIIAIVTAGLAAPAEAALLQPAAALLLA